MAIEREPRNGPDNSFSDASTEDSEAELAGPPGFRRWVALGAMLLLWAGCSVVVVGLWGPARYSLSASDPVSLGDLAEADLDGGPAYVRAMVEFDGRALAFSRRGGGDYWLAPVARRPEVLVVLQVPSALGATYIPPRIVAGRVLSLRDAGAHERPVLQLAGKEHPEARFLLLEGQSPRAMRWALVALALSAAVASACLGVAFKFWRPL